MIRLTRILSRFDVAVADYSDRQDYRYTRYRCRFKNDGVEAIPAGENAAPETPRSSLPLLLYVRGYGVIDKPARQADQVIADKGKFLFSDRQDGTVCFVRRSQIGPLLEKEGKNLLHVECVREDTDVVAACRECYASCVTWKNVLRTDTLGERLAHRLYQKVRLFVPMIVLGALSVNFAVRGPVDEKYAENHALLVALQKEKGRRNELSKQERELLGTFSTGICSGFARLGDRIGRSVPESLVLRQLSVQPLAKPLETGKPLRLETSVVRIKGLSWDASGISLFAARLRDIEGVRGVKIASMEKTRDGKSLDFIIEMEL